MKFLKYSLPLFSCILLFSCKKVIELYPQSNLNTGTFYSNYEEVKAGLSGCYNGLQAPMETEWMLTELRSDNSKQGTPSSSTAQNKELNELDMFTLGAPHQKVYDYWLNTYYNIRNANIVLQKLGIQYNPATGTIHFNNINIPITQTDRKQLAGEAMFIRAYHYFNLVRLFGDVFLVHEPTAPDAAKKMNRASTSEIYKLIQADLRTAADSMNTLKFSQQNVADRGRATGWAAKGLLAKVLLTLNKKTEAIPLLEDVKNNSGYALRTNYTNAFSISNEVNSEILFAIRYKAGGFGMGAPFANMFAPTGSGSAVVNGDGNGYNTPTAALDTALVTEDSRRSLLIASYGSGTNTRLYTRKYLSAVAVARDAENDWPVLRFADILLMLAEAHGFSPSSLALISQVRTTAGLSPLDPATVNTLALFEQALSNERRLEFAFENQRFFDLLRFNTTLTTITAEATIKKHFSDEYLAHYRHYPSPVPTVEQMQSMVTPQRLLLPIPQKEIDTNTGLKINQNLGY